MHIGWADLEMFLAVADAGSLSGAAKQLRVTQPTVSRQLAELESLLGEPLFTRNVEGARLTAFGERMLEPARRMGESASEARLVAARAESEPRGVVRITAPPGLAFDLLAPFAQRCREELREVSLEVVATIAYLDLGRREADLGLRVEAPDRASSPRDLVTLASVAHLVAAFATRAYRATLPRKIELSDVGWIGWAPPLEHLPPNPQLAARIPGFRPVFASDDPLVQRRAAEAGVGAMLLPRLREAVDLPTSLVDLRLDLGGVTSAVHLVASRASLTIPRVRAVADRLASALEASVAGGRRRDRARVGAGGYGQIGPDQT